MRSKPFRAALVTLIFTAGLAAPAAVLTGAVTAAGASGVTCAGPAIAKPGGGYWTCTFDDEFGGWGLNRAKWLPITSASGANAGQVCFLATSRDVAVGYGHLVLTVRKRTPFLCQTPTGGFVTQYTAGQVATYTKFSQTYGRFSIRAQFPAATVAGLQSALWLWPDNSHKFGAWPRSGEIDIAEQYSSYPHLVVPYIHYIYSATTTLLSTHVNVATNNNCVIADVHAFHTYTLVWTRTTMTVSYDGHTCLIDNYEAAWPLTGGAPFNQPFFVALTQGLGMGANAVTPTTRPMPASTVVDWVRVWK